MPDKSCRTCAYGERFDKRPDEPSEWGCRYRNWEGYTDPGVPNCLLNGGMLQFYLKGEPEDRRALKGQANAASDEAIADIADEYSEAFEILADSKGESNAD